MLAQPAEAGTESWVVKASKPPAEQPGARAGLAQPT